MSLPKPECEQGYPWTQIEGLLDQAQLEKLRDWMYGQTMSLCEEHGGVIYPWDLRGFLQGSPITD